MEDERRSGVPSCRQTKIESSTGVGSGMDGTQLKERESSQSSLPLLILPI